MITPVVLIMASSSLILSTSQRLSRSIERTRKLASEMNKTVQESEKCSPFEELSVLFDQLELATIRCRLLQKAMASLYTTLFIFISSCIGIAVIYFTDERYAWIPVALDVAGVGFLFYASLILIKESRFAISAVNKEMDHTVRLFRKHFPDLSMKDNGKWWRKFRFFKA